MMTGSYFIIQGLELEGVKAICVDTASWAVLSTSPRAPNPSPCQPEGLQCGVIWSSHMSGDLSKTMDEIWNCGLYICLLCFLKEKAQHESLKTSGLCPHEYCLNTVVLHLVVHHCPFCRPCDSKFSRVPCTRLGLSSLAFLSSSPSPPGSCCTKTPLSGNTGLSSKSKHFQEKTWKSIFSVSTPLCPLCCHLEGLVVKLPTLLLA